MKDVFPYQGAKSTEIIWLILVQTRKPQLKNKYQGPVVQS